MMKEGVTLELEGRGHTLKRTGGGDIRGKRKSMKVKSFIEGI